MSPQNQLIEDNLTLEMRRAPQQPIWENPEQVLLARELLASRAPLVQLADVDKLHRRLSDAARGELLVLQVGDCAEDPAERTAGHVAAKTELLERLADMLERDAGVPVLRVGRIAGQFAKPRSKDTELIDGVELPSYRGHIVNSPEPDLESRRPDPLRLLTSFSAAAEIMGRLGWRPDGAESTRPAEPTVWTSHEALLLDYEQPLVRQHSDGRRWLGSTHWPWIGERTRQLYGQHVALLAQVSNPVACKVGPSMSAGEVTLLCELLDSNREPGRLTLIARMGADAVVAKLPELVAAVRTAGHPVIWLCDPMHGNGTVTPEGRKTRYVTAVIKEVHAFRRAVELAGGVAGGLHLETTPDDVLECVDDAFEAQPGRWTSLCDPRLNAAQAAEVVAAWTTAMDPVGAARAVPSGLTRNREG
ncbi:3-deoxy-7-phosphoheptulonate synthase [Nocardia salmonicida]|uniref:3-deoxy-7-phosphoheptulonate synthase n=1 Tax=Nocardia salmonicida TaxID=53431 RepID=UPI003624EFA7